MTREILLKYGCNPNQQPARIYREQGELPLRVLCGRPGYINFMDALNSWQLVKELKEATGMPAAASFKHVSPAGAAIGLPLKETDKRAFFLPKATNPSPMACAYLRARGADRVSSYGDWAALSDICDADTANALRPEVSDGVIAPGYTDEALSILKQKRKGTYNIVEIDPEYTPEAVERRQIYGITFEQGRNDCHIDAQMLEDVVTRNRDLPEVAKRDLLIALITLKYTQSNSVCYAKDGGAIGIGAGQQSRIHCTRLAGHKADQWFLRRHPRVLDLPFLEDLPRPARDNAIDVYLSAEQDELLQDGSWQRCFSVRPEALSEQEKASWLSEQNGVSLGSDAFFPFEDNIERARRSGVQYIAQPGGSIRDRDVIDACDRYVLWMCFTHQRLFHH